MLANCVSETSYWEEHCHHLIGWLSSTGTPVMGSELAIVLLPQIFTLDVTPTLRLTLPKPTSTSLSLYPPYLNPYTSLPLQNPPPLISLYALSLNPPILWAGALQTLYPHSPAQLSPLLPFVPLQSHCTRFSFPDHLIYFIWNVEELFWILTGYKAIFARRILCRYEERRPRGRRARWLLQEWLVWYRCMLGF